MNYFFTIFSLSFLLFTAPLYANQKSTPASIQTLEGEDPDNTDKIELYTDLDEDSVKDKLDHCQNSGSGYLVDKYGCELDSDGDGIFDQADQCPNTKMGVAVNFLGCEGDMDKDQVLDSVDQCPDTPLGAYVNDTGCILENDVDHDGIPEPLDQCPNSPKGATVNQYGCVPQMKVVINVTFPPNSAKIPSTQKPNLDKDASKLKELKADEVILITGHTDSQGTNLNNMKLSWARAQSVKNYAIKNLNIPSQRVYLLGKGETSPIASNLTKEGREKNRRIEFNIISLRNLPKTATLEAPPEMTWVRR